MLGDLCQNGVIVAGLAVRRHGSLHGDVKAFAGSEPDVVTLERSRRGQHDVGALGRRSPILFVHHDGFRLAPRAIEPSQVLMMMKRIAARPIHQADVRVVPRDALIGEGRAGREQKVRDARDGNEVLDLVCALRKHRSRNATVRAAHDIHRAIAEPIATTGQPNLPDHGSQRDQHPKWLLPVRRALQGPGDVEHGSTRQQFAQQDSRCAQQARR